MPRPGPGASIFLDVVPKGAALLKQGGRLASGTFTQHLPVSHVWPGQAVAVSREGLP